MMMVFQLTYTPEGYMIIHVKEIPPGGICETHGRNKDMSALRHKT